VEGEKRRGVAERMREMPVPSWIPRMTGRGVCLARSRREPVTERMRRATPTRRPARRVVWAVVGVERDAAAIAWR
jgi:hypothetical protein